MKKLLSLMLRGLSILLISLYAFSCQQKSNPKVEISQRDIVLKKYLLEVDSLPYLDTSESNYRILKAYQRNDTGSLKNIIIQFQQDKEYSERLELVGSFIHQKKLQELGVDEAYRFIYLPAFCTQTINVTITRKDDSCNLHFILCQNQTDTGACRIISEFDKGLSSKSWDDINMELESADIWGLKRENGIHGLDGSNMIFIGYKKGSPCLNKPDQICYAYRWAFSTVRNALTLVLKFSGNNKGCYWVK